MMDHLKVPASSGSSVSLIPDTSSEGNLKAWAPRHGAMMLYVWVFAVVGVVLIEDNIR